MSATPLAQPALYAGGEDGRPVLHGQQCTACGHVAFPAQDYGCVSCGARGDAVEPMALRASGRLHACARVNRPPRKDQPPFVIGEIHLDDGPFVRAMLELPGDAEPPRGQRMLGCLVTTTENGREVLALRFKPAQE